MFRGGDRGTVDPTPPSNYLGHLVYVNLESGSTSVSGVLTSPLYTKDRSRDLFDLFDKVIESNVHSSNKKDSEKRHLTFGTFQNRHTS